MKNHSHSHIPLLVLAISVTLVVAALYWYMYDAAGTSVIRASLARDVVATEQYDQLQARNLSVLASSTQADRDEIGSFFVPSDDVVAFITLMESFGKESGSKAAITSIDADDLSNSSPGTTGRMHLHVDATGSWSEVMDLLGLVENSPYVGTISHVRLTANTGEATKSRWLLSFDIQTLLLVLPAPSPSATSSPTA
jgi:hypothetical protein